MPPVPKPTHSDCAIITLRVLGSLLVSPVPPHSSAIKLLVLGTERSSWPIFQHHAECLSSFISDHVVLEVENFEFQPFLYVVM